MSASGRLLVLALAGLTLVGCTRRDGDVIPTDVVLEDVPDQETWDVTLAIAHDGRRRALVRAAHLARFEREDSTFTRFGAATPLDTTRVSVDVFDEAGEPSANVEADRLLYFDEDRRFLAEGRVVVQTETGKTLRSEELTWDEAARRLRTEGFVRITTPDEQLQGYRLDAEESLDTYTLARITGQVRVEDE